MAVTLGFLVVSLALLATVSNAQLGLSTTVLCTEVACSEGWICQNACSSWCGLKEPTEARPVCNPKSDTWDAPPPTVPSNRCSITDCGFRSVDFVSCPPGVTYGYKYAGTSCVRQGDGSCKWELADCQFIPTGPCGAAECGPEPAMPTNTQIECSGNYNGTRAHYECNRDNLGQCRWVFFPCQVGCLPGMVDLGVICAMNDPCSVSNIPAPSVDCDPTQIMNGGGCVQDYCGGCNRRYYDSKMNEICIGATRTCANIMCKSGYRCYEGQSLGHPYCQNTLTCDNIRCDSGYKCNMTSTGPTCVADPQPFVLTCDYIRCSSYHTCTNVNGLAQCIPMTGACTSTDCASKPTCWDNSVASGGSCTRLASGKCTWLGTTCPVESPPPPTNAAGEKNCLVGTWSAWSCSALNCGDSGVQIRTRVVTQSPTGAGLPCPDLIERGVVCTKTCSPLPPPPIVPIGTATCAAFPGCTTDVMNKCVSPYSTATCVSGTWRVTGNVDVGQLGFVGCNLAITGSLTSDATSNLRIHACAKITTTSSATINGRLSLDIYNVSLAAGSRVTVVQGSSISGTFSTTLVTGFSITDSSLPFKSGYSTVAAYVDFGPVGNPPPSNTTSVLNPPSTTASTTNPPSTTAPPSTTTPTTTNPTTTAPNVPDNAHTLAPLLALAAAVLAFTAY